MAAVRKKLLAYADATTHLFGEELPMWVWTSLCLAVLAVLKFFQSQIARLFTSRDNHAERITKLESDMPYIAADLAEIKGVITVQNRHLVDVLVKMAEGKSRE